VKLASEPPPACPPFSCLMKFSSSLFASPLFSQPYELLVPPARRSLGEQALCSDNHLNRPGVCCWGRSALLSRHSPLATSLAFSVACSLFGALGSLFRASALCFQQLPASFCKIPGGVGYPLAFSASLRNSALSAPLYPEPRRVRYPYTRILGLPRSTNLPTTPPTFRLSTVDCRLPSHNAKIHSNSL
jgi:hypothetical protein